MAGNRNESLHEKEGTRQGKDPVVMQIRRTIERADGQGLVDALTVAVRRFGANYKAIYNDAAAYIEATYPERTTRGSGTMRRIAQSLRNRALSFPMINLPSAKRKELAFLAELSSTLPGTP